MNAGDGDRLRTALLARGFEETEEARADVVIFITCSIRDKAEQKVASELGRLDVSWRQDRRPLVAVLGCMAQRVGADLVKRFPCVRLVAGPRHLGRVPEALEAMAAGAPARLLLDDDPHAVDDLEEAPLRRANPWKAFVSIAHGCDNFCTYCIVPYVRGRFRSREPGDVLRDVRALVDDGVLEVTLVGQNVNSYGTDRSDGWSFSRLLLTVAAIPGLKRLRFATNHPKDLTGDVVYAMAEGAPVVCPALNLPIQSGSDRILQLMNRGYTVEDYARRLLMLRGAMPDIGITSDLIVGFPGETEDDFAASRAALVCFRFDQVHTAAYSPRPGTKAVDMPGVLPREVGRRRLEEINALQRAIAHEINQKLVGREYDVLFDGLAPRGAGLVQGRTPTDKVVLMPGGRELLGRMVRVRIVSGEHWCLRAEPVEIAREGEGESGR